LPAARHATAIYDHLGLVNRIISCTLSRSRNAAIILVCFDTSAILSFRFGCKRSRSACSTKLPEIISQDPRWRSSDSARDRCTIHLASCPTTWPVESDSGRSALRTDPAPGVCPGRLGLALSATNRYLRQVEAAQAVIAAQHEISPGPPEGSRTHVPLS